VLGVDRAGPVGAALLLERPFETLIDEQPGMPADDRPEGVRRAAGPATLALAAA